MIYKGNTIQLTNNSDGSIIIRFQNRFGFRWFKSSNRKDLYSKKLPMAAKIEAEMNIDSPYAFKCPIIL